MQFLLRSSHISENIEVMTLNEVPSVTLQPRFDRDDSRVTSKPEKCMVTR